MTKIRKPVPADDVYICGEAYSNNQGWVEGAFRPPRSCCRSTST